MLKQSVCFYSHNGFKVSLGWFSIVFKILQHIALVMCNMAMLCKCYSKKYPQLCSHLRLNLKPVFIAYTD